MGMDCPNCGGELQLFWDDDRDKAEVVCEEGCGVRVYEDCAITAYTLGVDSGG